MLAAWVRCTKLSTLIPVKPGGKYPPASYLRQEGGRVIHLIAIATSPGVWTITTSDMREKYERPDKLITKMRESGREWIEDGLKKESGREERDNATK